MQLAVVGRHHKQGKRSLNPDWMLPAHDDQQRPKEQRQCCTSPTASKPRPASTPDTHFDLESISHWRCQEVQLQPSPGTIWRHQDEVTSSMRLILVDWLSQVCEHLHQHRDVIFLTINFLDRFLSASKISKAEFQLLGIACLWVAAKYEAVHPPPAKLLVRMTNNLYKLPQLLEMEGRLLSALGFRLGAPTPVRFLDHYAQQAGPVSPSIRLQAEQLLDLAVLVYPYGPCGGDSSNSAPASPQPALRQQAKQAWAAAASDDGSQDEDAAPSLQRVGSCCSTSTEASYPATCFQSSDSEEAEDAGSLPSQGSPLLPATPSRSAATAAPAVCAGALRRPADFPQGRGGWAVDFMLVAAALPSQLAAAALCAAMEVHQMPCEGLMLALAKLAECDPPRIQKLSQVLIQLKTALPVMTSPMCCTFVKRHGDARARLCQAFGMTVNLTGHQEKMEM